MNNKTTHPLMWLVPFLLLFYAGAYQYQIGTRL
jgi:hypothetical protein